LKDTGYNVSTKEQSDKEKKSKFRKSKVKGQKLLDPLVQLLL